MLTYNSEKFLIESIKFVFNQTYQNWELIIVNDGSIVNTYDIICQLMSLESRIKYLNHPENYGAEIVRNKGVELAKEEFLHFWIVIIYGFE